jgi:hypothetical protein
MSIFIVVDLYQCICSRVSVICTICHSCLNSSSKDKEVLSGLSVVAWTPSSRPNSCVAVGQSRSSRSLQSVVLPAATYEMTKRLLTLSLARERVTTPEQFWKLKSCFFKAVYFVHYRSIHFFITSNQTQYIIHICTSTDISPTFFGMNMQFAASTCVKLKTSYSW